MAYGTIMGQTPRGGGTSGGGKRYATVVVGTSTAGWTAADCDFLCDGTDDQVEINAAIASLKEIFPSQKVGEVLLLDGIYNLTDSLSLMTYSTLRGVNRDSVVLKRMTTTPTGSNVALVIGSNQSTIKDLSYDGNASIFTSGTENIYEFLAGGGAIVENVTFNDCANNAIYAEPLLYLATKISGCDFRQIVNCCVYADTQGVLFFENSTVAGASNYILSAYGQNFDGTASKGVLSVTISNVKNGYSLGFHGKILLNGVGFSTVENCSCNSIKILNTVPSANFVERGRNIITNNHFFASKDNSVVITLGSGVNNCIVTGNILSSYLTTGTIQDNGANNIKVNNQ